MSVSVTANGQKLRVTDGNAQYDIFMSKITVYYQGNNVIIQWDNVDQIVQPYTNYSSPSGASAAAVQAAIAALMIVV